MIRFRRLFVTGIAAITLAASPSRPAVALRHANLTRSVPAKNDTLASSPKMVQLWFSEAVELPLLTVRVKSASGTAAALGAATYDGEPAAASPISLALKSPVGPGTYAVSWSVAGKDGHPTKGTFGFVVRSAK